MQRLALTTSPDYQRLPSPLIRTPDRHLFNLRKELANVTEREDNSSVLLLQGRPETRAKRRSPDGVEVQSVGDPISQIILHEKYKRSKKYKTRISLSFFFNTLKNDRSLYLHWQISSSELA